MSRARTSRTRNTEGYTRQVAVLRPTKLCTSLAVPNGEGGQLGPGVVTGFTRIRNEYLDSQYRTQNAALGAARTRAERADPGAERLRRTLLAGIASQLSAFWSAWSGLSNNPTSEAAKVAVVSAGRQLPTTLKQVDGQLEGIETQASLQYQAIAAPTGNSRADAKQIAQLNEQISSRSRQTNSRTNLKTAATCCWTRSPNSATSSSPRKATGPTRSSSATPPNRSSKARRSTGRRRSRPHGGKLGALLETTARRYDRRIPRTLNGSQRRSPNRSTRSTPPARFHREHRRNADGCSRAAEVQTAGPGNPEETKSHRDRCAARRGAEQQYAA